MKKLSIFEPQIEKQYAYKKHVYQIILPGGRLHQEAPICNLRAMNRS